MENLTPAMRQYMEIKNEYRDCILFFRMGDFYEMFFEDAVTASKILDIALTSRNKNKESAVPLCGVPYHAASGYIAKLIENGFRVAICEQVEDLREAKGIVKREVVRVVTPGLIIDPDNLSPKEHNFIAAVDCNGGFWGCAFADISTGEFFVSQSDEAEIFFGELAGLPIRELLAAKEIAEMSPVKQFASRMPKLMVTALSDDYVSRSESADIIAAVFGANSESFADVESSPAMARAAAFVLRYIEETQKERLAHIAAATLYAMTGYLVMDEAARRNLELFFTIQDRRKEGSLISVIDETITGMGGRRLRWWLTYPLVDPGRIRDRLGAVSELKEDHVRRAELRKLLAGMYDLERLAGRVAMGAANGRDLAALKNSLRIVPAVREAISTLKAPLLAVVHKSFDDHAAIVSLIDRSIVDDPPFTIREGGLIREGYDADLDELIRTSSQGKRWIASLESRERQKTGISTLKVGFNSVFGYYIEVTKANAPLVPVDYVRKQTLVNAERYINEELKKYEDTVLNAEEKRRLREYDLFQKVREEVAGATPSIQKTASAIADLDVLAALAEVAELYDYCCPRVDDGDIIEIREGRHPVVERLQGVEGFVPNDLKLDRSGNRFLIITGPNMAGKSTYIRQTALIVLMAQMGSFVPAREATIGVVDKIFTRVGAADSLARGQSTFMVEMTEVAAILSRATGMSLILLDEVGRGTSTCDGLSIAWAVAEHIHDSERLGARTLFATHYHELMDLAKTREGVKNYSIAVKEWGDKVIFLRKIIEGGTNRSYGIQVAKLAGVPDDVISRAREIMANLESGEFDAVGLPKLARGRRVRRQREELQFSLFADESDRIATEIKDFELSSTTPLEALTKLDEWQRRLKKS
ncbi:MAG: DNA mismatch repair protein MutS [Deltaproteobacteria bacterium]|nr:DNA mismatch repair protein MutS [Deltaproteobacteria bacterium]